MKAYLLLLIVALSISNVSSKIGRTMCQRCSNSIFKFWKHCNSPFHCTRGVCMREGFSHDCGQYLSNENLASLGNENQEDYSSIDLL